MSRRPKRKKVNHQKKLKKAKPKEGIKKKAWFATKKIYGALAVVFTVLGWITFKDTIHKWITPEYILFKEENFVQGILLPDKLLGDEEHICIGFGTFQQCYSVNELKKGKEFIPNMFICDFDNDYPVRCKFKIINNRLYISDSLRSLDNDNLVGILNDNRWQLKKQEMFEFINDDKRLQVIDNKGNIMLSVAFQEPNTVLLHGYFIKEKSAAVISDKGFMPCINKTDSNWKKLVANEASFIKPVF